MAKTLELANKNCRFEPHIVITQTGDTLNVTNPDPVGHNCNLPFFANRPENFTIPPGGAEKVKLELAEPGPVPAACNIHPWMNAKVVVLGHPYAAKSDETGTLVIKNLPVGELAFRLYVEAAGKLSGLKIAGEKLDRRSLSSSLRSSRG
ncbi:MAG: methylamine utilization protein [Pirellulaceae bacterium]